MKKMFIILAVLLSSTAYAKPYKPADGLYKCEVSEYRMIGTRSIHLRNSKEPGYVAFDKKVLTMSYDWFEEEGRVSVGKFKNANEEYLRYLNDGIRMAVLESNGKPEFDIALAEIKMSYYFHTCSKEQ